MLVYQRVISNVVWKRFLRAGMSPLQPVDCFFLQGFCKDLRLPQVLLGKVASHPGLCKKHGSLHPEGAAVATAFCCFGPWSWWGKQYLTK